jgi:DNA-binding CsgD family transcriptional regulator
MSEFNLGIFLFALFAGVIIVAWITIDDEDLDERFEHNRKMRFEDEEK